MLSYGPAQHRGPRRSPFLGAVGWEHSALSTDMACPFFHPTQNLSAARVRLKWPANASLPLGDPYEGECLAREDGYRPGDEELKNLCNLGYARNKCPRFPPGEGPDAVRFCAWRDAGGMLSIRFVRERDCRPWDHGLLVYSVAEKRLVEPHADRSMNRQAEAYAEAYLRRRPAGLAAEAPAHG